MNIQFGVEVLGMGLHRVQGNIEISGNLFASHPRIDKFQDHLLALRQEINGRQSMMMAIAVMATGVTVRTKLIES